MSQKFQGVFVPKHKTEEEWAKSNYIPSLGEIVIYDPTETTPFYRFKRGNGVLQVPQIANFMTMKEYSLEKRGNNIILRDSEGKESSIPDTDLSNYATLKYVDDEINDKTLGFFSNKSSDD
jgi:hypothetical protein